MQTKLLIQNDNNVTLDYASITQSVVVSTNRKSSPGKMSFKINKAGEADFAEGNSVVFSVDQECVFFGYVFTKKKNRWGEIEVTCYDQLRFLKAKNSYLFIGVTASDIVKKIANDFNLRLGDIEDTVYVIPSLVKENTSCLDTINYALQITTFNTGKIYVLYDDNGQLCLKEAAHMMKNITIGTKSLLQDYNYNTSIDSDTYNQIKLVRPNKSTGKTDVIIVEDSNNIQRWGLLQLYEKVDENLNDAQVAAQGETMLEYYNRVLRTLTIESQGVVGLRAGMMIFINVPDLGDISLSKYVLLDKVTHTFENDIHTMSIETRSIFE